MSEPEIRGLCPPAYDKVRTAFADNFARGEELGARFTVTLDGEVVVDLMGGFADRGRTRAYAENTLTPIFSTTKLIASVLIARLVDQGRLDYHQRVSQVWPEFAQNGKQDITVEQVMSHQAGLSGLPEQMEPSLWLDWEAICTKLAAMSPLWPPGSASGYHPVTFGYLAGEIFRRVDGRTMGVALRQDIAERFVHRQQRRVLDDVASGRAELACAWVFQRPGFGRPGHGACGCEHARREQLASIGARGLNERR